MSKTIEQYQQLELSWHNLFSFYSHLPIYESEIATENEEKSNRGFPTTSQQVARIKRNAMWGVKNIRLKHKIVDFLEIEAKKEIKKLIPLYKGIKLEGLSDGEFLLALQVRGRNYRTGCVICLEDNMKGTPCGCGHTEIIVFKPCGHSICASPCFTKFIKSVKPNFQSKPTILTTTDGLKFTIPDKPNFEGLKNFSCPMCRTQVTYTFRAEDAILPSEKFPSLPELPRELQDQFRIL